MESVASSENKENIDTMISHPSKSVEGQTKKESNDNELLWIGSNNAKVDLKSNFEKFKKQKVE